MMTFHFFVLDYLVQRFQVYKYQIGDIPSTFLIKKNI